MVTGIGRLRWRVIALVAAGTAVNDLARSTLSVAAPTLISCSRGGWLAAHLFDRRTVAIATGLADQRRGLAESDRRSWSAASPKRGCWLWRSSSL
jgi:hypothetical protein